jgi:hypothetical protein
MSLGAVPFDGGHGHNRVWQYPADDRLGVQIFESQSVTFLAEMSSHTINTFALFNAEFQALFF